MQRCRAESQARPAGQTQRSPRCTCPPRQARTRKQRRALRSHVVPGLQTQRPPTTTLPGGQDWQILRALFQIVPEGQTHRAPRRTLFPGQRAGLQLQDPLSRMNPARQRHRPPTTLAPAGHAWHRPAVQFQTLPAGQTQRLPTSTWPPRQRRGLTHRALAGFHASPTGQTQRLRTTIRPPLHAWHLLAAAFHTEPVGQTQRLPTNNCPPGQAATQRFRR